MGVEVGVLSANPTRTIALYPGIKCFDVSRGRLRAILAAAMWSDIIIVGGGELVQDVSSMAYSLFNLLPLYLAILFKKKAFAWAVGIGQGNELAPLTPCYTKLALKGCQGITVRDRGSFNTLHKLGFREPDLILTSDCALTLPIMNSSLEKSNILGAAPRNVSNRSRKLLPLEIRKKFKNYEEPDPLPTADAWADFLDKHIDRHSSEVILFPFHTGSLSNDDHEFCDLVQSRMNYSSSVRIADPSKPVEFISLISSCRVMVSTPLHGLIMAVATATVPVSISYASKCTRFMEQAELEEYLPEGKAGVPSKSAVTALEKAWINSDYIQQQMISVREELVQRAEKTSVHFRKIFNL